MKSVILKEILETALHEKAVMRYTLRNPSLREDVFSASKIALVDFLEEATPEEIVNLIEYLDDGRSSRTVGRLVLAMRYQAQWLMENSAAIHVPRDKHREGIRVNVTPIDNIGNADSDNWVTEPEDKTEELIEGLPERDRVVCRMLSQGYTQTEIAVVVGVSRPMIWKIIKELKWKLS